jgi:Tfp pilus assembly protein PilW
VQRGFTVLEALLSMTIFLFILTAVLSIYEPARRLYVRGDRRVDIQMNGRLALAQISRQVRMAGYFPENFAGGTLADPIRIATDRALAVYGDTRDAGASDVTMFCLDGTDLRRTSGAVNANSSYTCTSGQVVASNVSALRFAYYGADNTPIPNPPTTPYTLDSQAPGATPNMTTTTQRGAVRRIVVTLTTSAPDPNAGTEQEFTLVSDVWRRNG